jgi:hypothetical protein
MSRVLETMLLVTGFLLIPFLCTEPCQQGLARLQTVLRQRPRLKYIAYPLGALLFLGAAALIIHTLLIFAASRFSYD